MVLLQEQIEELRYLNSRHEVSLRFFLPLLWVKWTQDDFFFVVVVELSTSIDNYLSVASVVGACF